MDIYQRKLLDELLKKVVILLYEEPEFEIINEIYKRNYKIISDYNWDNKTVIDASKTELGIFKSACKKVICARIKENDFKNKKNYKKLYDLIENTDFSEQLINSKILLNRRCNFYNLTPLEKELNATLKLEIEKEFIKKNKKYLKL